MGCMAQDVTVVDEADSLQYSGVISNLHSGKPQPYSLLRFVREGKEVAQVRCDAEGRFDGLSLASGDYQLFVKVHGLTVYTADLRLSESGYMNLQVDTVQLVTLKEITVEGMKHMLGSLLITSPHDLRLWGMNAGYRNGNASVQLPLDAHGNLDVDATTGLMFDPELPLRLQRYYVGGPFYTFGSGPIWTLVPDRVIPAPAPDTVAATSH